jgi:hypothetical protein
VVTLPPPSFRVPKHYSVTQHQHRQTLPILAHPSLLAFQETAGHPSSWPHLVAPVPSARVPFLPSVSLLPRSLTTAYLSISEMEKYAVEEPHNRSGQILR